MRTVAVYGGKGGIGKTTIAEALAWQFADKGKTVLMDADYQESASTSTREMKVTCPYTVTSTGETHELDGAEYIVMDMPPSIEEARPLLTSADLIVVPYVPRYRESSALTKTLLHDLVGMPVVVIMSRVSHQHANNERVLRAFLSGAKILLLDTVLRARDSAHERAGESGIPLLHENAKGYKLAEARQDMRDMFTEVSDLLEVL